eukprot:GHVS01002801.1.p1 GENE.GHVS01002801.1~~GHVS01002801.1.p1  ORF type:complete len:181 (-),score=21.68 GHVS01002801.1:317-859(-)
MEKVPVSSTCSKELPTTEEYTCTKTRFEAQCSPVTKEFHSTCYRDAKKQKAYQCPTVDYKESCTKVPVVVEGTCTKQLPTSESYKCHKTINKQQCETVTTNEQATCYKDGIKKEAFTCYKTEYVTQCTGAGGSKGEARYAKKGSGLDKPTYGKKGKVVVPTIIFVKKAPFYVKKHRSKKM